MTCKRCHRAQKRVVGIPIVVKLHMNPYKLGHHARHVRNHTVISVLGITTASGPSLLVDTAGAYAFLNVVHMAALAGSCAAPADEK